MKTLLGFLWIVVMVTPVAAAEKPIALDPNAGYVLVEVANLDNPMFKGTKVPGSLTLARYDPVKGDVRGGLRSPQTALPAKVPVRVMISSKPVAKTKTSRLYLVRLEPDIWVIEGANGTAFSLGSRSFVVKAGDILDLGFMTPAVDWVEGEGPKSVLGGTMIGMALLGGRKPEARPVRVDIRARRADDLPLPAVLTGRTVSAVEFTLGQKFGNYLGGLVNRFDGRAGRTAAPAALP